MLYANPVVFILIKLNVDDLNENLLNKEKKKSIKVHKRMNKLNSSLSSHKYKPLRVKEHASVMNSIFRDDPNPIDSNCQCYTCQNFSRAYLHHLFKAKESLGGTLCTIHNVYHMNALFADIRQSIRDDRLNDIEMEWIHPTLLEQLNEQERDLPTIKTDTDTDVIKGKQRQQSSKPEKRLSKYKKRTNYKGDQYKYGNERSNEYINESHSGISWWGKIKKYFV